MITGMYSLVTVKYLKTSNLIGKPKSSKLYKFYCALIGLMLLSMGNLALAQGHSSFQLPQLSLDSQALPPPTNKKPITFIAYDGSDWTEEKNQTKNLEHAASNPRKKVAPVQMQNGEFVVNVSPDGHYYIPGGVNGFPVMFMVDSGAVYSSIPLRLARNAGIRVGISNSVNTANGLVNVGQTSGNIITFGTIGIADVHVLVISGLETALLGAEVLNTLDISYRAGVMTIKAVKNRMPIPIDALDNYR
jgi:aspartyl protease family protein